MSPAPKCEAHIHTLKALNLFNLGEAQGHRGVAAEDGNHHDNLLGLALDLRNGSVHALESTGLHADFFVALPDEEGRILGPAGDGRVVVVAREDAGRVAAGVLTDPARYENQTLDVTGPEALTLDEIAAILTRVQGRPVTYVRETIEEAYESRKKWPAAQWQYDSWVSTYTSIARREMDVVSTTVRDVTGRDPLTFEEVARAALTSGR